MKQNLLELIHQTLTGLLPIFTEFFKESYQKKNLRQIIDNYLCEQSIVCKSNAEMFAQLANQRVYGLVIRLVFYLFMKKYFDKLPELPGTNNVSLKDSLSKIFAAASETIHPVFAESSIAQPGLPDEAIPFILNLIKQLHDQYSNRKSFEVLNEIFEDILDQKQRHVLGQFYTPDNLTNLVIATIVNKADGMYADPTCGSGKFLTRLYDRLLYLNKEQSNSQLLNKIWGIDIGKFPALLATINMLRLSGFSDEANPAIINKSIFDIKKGSPVELRFANNSLKAKVPEFSGLVGNFPFIRQELLERKTKGFRKQLTKLLAGEYFPEYPKLFKYKQIKGSEITKLNQLTTNKKKEKLFEWVDKNYLELQIPGQSDIYTYIFIHTATLLKPGGEFAIITSNSWLDVAYGTILKEFFLDHFKIKTIVCSWVEPWFADAAINTVFTVLEKTDKADARNQNLVKFVSLKKPLNNLISNNGKTRIEHWKQVDELVNEMETSEKTACKISNKITAFQNQNMHIKLIKQENLFLELSQNEKYSKWGKYLRAPDVYFKLIDNLELIKIEDYFSKETYLNTGGADKFFIINNETIQKFELDDRFYVPLIKSSQELDTIKIGATRQTKNFLFRIDTEKFSYDKLPASVKNYLSYGEKNGFHLKSGRKSSNPWYRLPKQAFTGGELVIGRTINDTFIVHTNQNKLITNRFYRLHTKTKKISTAFLGAMLNSSLFFFLLEAGSPTNLGEGALNFYDIEKLQFFDLENITQEAIQKVENKFAKITQRKILPLGTEVQQSDRNELDVAVLEALNLNPKEYLDTMYKGFSELVNQRINLPKMRKKGLRPF